MSPLFRFVCTRLRHSFRPPRRLVPGLTWMLAGLILAPTGSPLRAVPFTPATDILQPATNVVAREFLLEFNIQWDRHYTNAFDPVEVTMDLEVTDSSGELIRLPAFFLQDYDRGKASDSSGGATWLFPRSMPGWKARFAPMVTGSHKAQVVIRDHYGEHRSQPVDFQVIDSNSPGYVRVSQNDPRFFELRPARGPASARPFFPVGQNLAFIGVSQYVSLDRAEQIMGRLAQNGANYLRIWTGCLDWAIGIESRKSAFSRSWEARPPVAAHPDDSSRKSLHLSPTNRSLRVEPSHRVPLRPLTLYTLRGKYKGHNAGLQIKLRGLTHTFPASASGWKDFAIEFSTGETERWLGALELVHLGDGELWLESLSLRERNSPVELLWEADVNRPTLGVYNQPDCFMVDELVRTAEREGIYLQLCLLTRDLYMNRLSDPNSPAYAKAIVDAKRFMRYAVARWGYSRAVAAWEYWNEMDPGKPAEKFYNELAAYLDAVDPYRHLRSTSTWGPSVRDCKLPALDFADTHFYLRPADRDRLDDEVHAVVDRATWLRSNAPNKPAILGELGIADDQWRLRPEMNQRTGLVDFHNALWASALSGLSGTGLAWWWERLDQQDVYPLYRPLSLFIRDVPWTTGALQPVSTDNDANLRVLGLQSRGDQAWIWLVHKDATWKSSVEGRKVPTVVGAKITIIGLNAGTWTLRWYHTRRAEFIATVQEQSSGPILEIEPPSFAGDLAVHLSRN